MIKTAKQLKDLIRNLSKKKSADAQILMRNYMMERFLERISLSQYQDKFILKGGMLVAAMVGLDARATMDIDATIKGADVNVEAVESIIMDIISVPMEDGVTFRIKQITEIMDEAEYPGVRVSMETVLAEKLETVISRGITNTRMRDYYDIHILIKLYGNTLNGKVLGEALLATAKKRETEYHLNDAQEIFDEIQNDSNMQKLWKSYQKKFSYASDISWEVVMESVRELYRMSRG